MWHAIEVQGRDYLFFFGGARSAGIARIKSAGSLPSARARIISMPSPTLASPCSMRTKYARAMPARAASARCDMPVSARAATTLRARARVSSFGAASASAADGVSGRRFALTPAKNTTASRRHPSVALPGPTGDVICLPTAGCYAESATAAPPYRCNTGKTAGSRGYQAGCPRQRTSSDSGGTTRCPGTLSRLPR